MGDEPSNMKPLLPGFMQYIGRARTLDDIEEANGISSKANRIFINTFLEYGSTILYKKWVTEPSLNRNVAEIERLFLVAGFNGCIESSDATCVSMLKCSALAHIIHKGFKLCVPSRTYNTTVDHSYRIFV